MSCGHRADPDTKVRLCREGICPACQVEMIECRRMELPHWHCPCCKEGWVVEHGEVRMVSHA